MSARRSIPLFLSAFGLMSLSISAADVPTAATRALLDEHPGLRALVDRERVRVLYGAALAIDADPATDTDQFVEGFLAQHADALGVDDVVLAFQSKINIGNDKFTVYTYTQTLEGLPVHRSVVKIPVLKGTTEKIGYIGMRVVQPPDHPLPLDVISGTDAIAAVQQSEEYGHLADFTQPEKAIHEARIGTLHRTWRFSGYDSREAYLFFVDTNNGEIIDAVNQILNGDVTGTVTGHGTPGISADNPNNADSCPDAAQGMRGIEVSIDIPGVDPVIADETGFFRFPAVPAGQSGTVTTRLVGEWVTVENHEDTGPNLESEPPAREITIPVDPTENVEDVDFVFNPTVPLCDPWPEEFDTAQVNAFLTVQKTHDWFKDLQQAYTGIDRSLLCRVNDCTETCRASYYWWIDEYINLHCHGGSCANTAFSTIVSHEYGHFILDQIIEDIPGSLVIDSLHEGVADTVAALTWDTKLIALDRYLNGEPLRNLDDPDFPDVRLNDCSSLPSWCDICEKPHCLGLALSGAFWDLRKEIGPEAVNRLFADFLMITDGRWDRSVLLELLIADDDDGDLTSTPPTPHYDQIIHAFVDKHGWPDSWGPDEGDVEVEWLPAIEAPVYGVDYFVYWIYQGDDLVPHIVLRTTEKPQGVPIQTWTIGRTGGGDIASVTANWDGASENNIRVRVGTIAPCDNLHVVEIAPQSDEHWSNIHLQLTGDLTSHAQCYPVSAQGPTFGDGGLISGHVGGYAQHVLGKAVGEEAGGSGALHVDQMYKLEMDVLPENAEFTASFVYDAVRFNEGVQGCIEIVVLSDYPAWVLPKGRDGRLEVGGPGPSTGEIAITSGIMGGQVIIEGVFAGTMNVSRMLEAEGILPLIEVGELESPGSVEVGEDVVGSVRITGAGESNGNVIVGRDIEAGGFVEIAGDMGGSVSIGRDLHEDASIHISGDLSGEVSIGRFIEGSVSIGGDISGCMECVWVAMTSPGQQPLGSIEIGGDMSGGIETSLHMGGTIEIHGDMYGHIWVGGEQGSQPILGEVVIDGVQNGDICADDFYDADFDIVFGPKGTVCGVKPLVYAEDFETDRLVYVDPAAPGPERNGTSWGTAFTSLQDALAKAETALPRATEIWVAAGTYTPDVGEGITPGDRTLSFELKDRVLMYGGFSGTENTRASRNPAVNKTVLSGDLSVNDGPGFVNRGDNAYHVVDASLTTCTAVLDGFVITGGNADGSGLDGYGGGMSIISGSPTITGCQFRGNSAVTTGGAIYNLSASPELTNCLFSGNRTTAGNGGAVRNSIDSNPAMVNCTFAENSAPNGNGGAIYSGGWSSSVLTNCILWGNSDSSGTGASAQISSDETSSLTVTYSCVQDDQPDDGMVYPCTSLPCSGATYNIDLNPEFIDSLGADGYAGTGDEDLHLYASSPCIEAGDNSVVTVEKDLDGKNRLHDADGDEEAPEQWATVDMGVYEYDCDVVPTPLNPPGEAGYTKNGYLSFLPGSSGEVTALRVTLTDYYDDDPEGPIGSQWWVGEPFQVCENSGQVAPPVEGCAAVGTAQRWLWVAPLVCDAGSAHQMDWSILGDYCVGGGNDGDPCTSGEDCPNGSCGSDLTVHVFDAAIVPSKWLVGPPAEISPTEYSIQVIHNSCDTGVEANYSAPLLITMSRWGDVVGDCTTTPCTPPDGIVSITLDVTAVLDKFKNLPGSPMKVRCDIVGLSEWPPDPVDQAVNIPDVNSSLAACLNWYDYPFSIPLSCP